ncbi:hypothetical protein BRARA_I04168 [Brassica rapa]|uniref:Uncharacterized protein n=1 Tax=Brassica campestris TaxID=3711 RepID=A0A397YA98_BRACM|nr:hypothetical protein BRARA_I04168 [Brassica rapa]
MLPPIRVTPEIRLVAPLESTGTRISIQRNTSFKSCPFICVSRVEENHRLSRSHNTFCHNTKRRSFSQIRNTTKRRASNRK